MTSPNGQRAEREEAEMPEVIIRRQRAAVARRMCMHAAIGSTLGLRRHDEQEYRVLSAKLERMGVATRLRAKYTGGIR